MLGDMTIIFSIRVKAFSILRCLLSVILDVLYINVHMKLETRGKLNLLILKLLFLNIVDNQIAHMLCLVGNQIICCNTRLSKVHSLQCSWCESQVS